MGDPPANPLPPGRAQAVLDALHDLQAREGDVASFIEADAAVSGALAFVVTTRGPFAALDLVLENLAVIRQHLDENGLDRPKAGRWQ